MAGLLLGIFRFLEVLAWILRQLILFLRVRSTLPGQQGDLWSGLNLHGSLAHPTFSGRKQSRGNDDLNSPMH